MRPVQNSFSRCAPSLQPHTLVLTHFWLTSPSLHTPDFWRHPPPRFKAIFFFLQMFLSCLTFPPALSVLPLCVYSNSLPSSAPPRSRPLVAVGNPSMWNKISLLWHRVSGWKGQPVYSQWPQPKQVSPQSSGLSQRLEVRLSQCQPAIMPRLFSVQPHSNHVFVKHSEEYCIRNVMAVAKFEK